MSQVLSEEQVKHYVRDGYISPIEVLTQGEIQTLNLKLQAFRERINLNGKIAGRYNQKPHLILPWADQIIRHPRILDAVEQLIGPNIFCWGSQFFSKDAGDNAYVSWRRGTQPLQINLTNHKYSRIIVGVPNAQALAEEINSAITGC